MPMILAWGTDDCAVLDACVLVPMALCGLLLRLAEDPAMYRPIWSEHIMVELSRVLKSKLNCRDEQISYRRQEMKRAFPEAMVTVPSALLDALTCIPDQHDRPVLAVAVIAHAGTIVTQNLRRFPKDCLDQFGVRCETAEEFLIRQFSANEQPVLDKLDDQSAAIARDRAFVLASLKRSVPTFVEKLQKHLR